jgi:hypothetical protein
MSSQIPNSRWKEFVDVLLVLGAALLVILIACGAYVLAGRYHVNSSWVYLGEISLGFFVTVGWDYRKEFRSVRFVIFFGGWLFAHLTIFVFVVAYLGWLYWLLALSVELFLFYGTAFWLFGLRPPPRRRH